jgi:hypothetical protein
VLTEIVLLEAAARHQSARHGLAHDEDADDSDQDQPIRMKDNLEDSMLTYSPKFGRKLRDAPSLPDRDPLGKRIRFPEPSEPEETVHDTPKKEHFIEIRRPHPKSPRSSPR